MSRFPSTSSHLSVAVVQGGPTSEASVSRASAASIAQALERVGHRVERVSLDAGLAAELRAGGFDVVFPIAHGAVGEDGSLQGMLEVLGLPFVGAGVLASALAMNKRVAKIVFAEAGLPVAPSVAVCRTNGAAANEARRALARLGAGGVVVKPCSNGSAIGVTRLPGGTTPETLVDAIDAAWAVDDTALVEAFVTGREITCGVLDAPFWSPSASALPPTEIRTHRDAFYNYEARYAPGRSEHFCPAPLGEHVTKRVQEIAVAAHRALGCRDLSRADFIVAENDAITLLEVNTLPGFTETSLYPEAAAAAGIALHELCDGLVRAATARGATPRNEALPLPA